MLDYYMFQEYWGTHEISKNSFSILVMACSLAIMCSLYACRGDSHDGPNGNTNVDPANIDPKLFVSAVNNPLFPLTPGTTLVYGGAEIVVVEVTGATREIAGVATTVVRDRVFEDGELVEDTEDWFAQDIEGSVWYFGEEVKDFEDGVLVSTAGSFEAGANGAQPGIQMFANPVAGTIYNQELAPGIAEDKSEDLDTNASVSTPFGSFTGCLMRREFNPLDPGNEEVKWYCPGVGFVKSVVSAHTDAEELGKEVFLVNVVTGPFNLDDLIGGGEE